MKHAWQAAGPGRAGRGKEGGRENGREREGERERDMGTSLPCRCCVVAIFDFIREEPPSPPPA